MSEDKQAASVGGEREAEYTAFEAFMAENGAVNPPRDMQFRCWMEGRRRAALSPAGGGVVMPEPLKRGDEGATGEYGAAMIRGYNACLREVARLNAKPQANSQEDSNGNA